MALSGFNGLSGRNLSVSVGVCREVVFSTQPTTRHIYCSHQLPKSNLVGVGVHRVDRPKSARLSLLRSVKLWT